MRKMLLLAACFTLLTAAAAHAEVTIAVFNVSDVALKSQAFKDGEQTLKNFESRSKALEKDREAIRTKMTAAMNGTPTKQQQDEIIKLQEGFQKKANAFADDFQKAEAKVRGDVDNAIIEASKVYAKQKGYNLLLDSNLVIYSDLPNVTDDILAETDKQWRSGKKKK